MNGTIQRWGDSHAVRLPKDILKTAFLQENDTVEIIAEAHKVIIIKSDKRTHIPLKERLRNFKGEYEFEEWDTGVPVGKEVL